MKVYAPNRDNFKHHSVESPLTLLTGSTTLGVGK